jgi:hypothetical protein
MTSSWNNEATHQIDLSSEESGVYFFKFSSEQGNTVKKVVLNTGR